MAFTDGDRSNLVDFLKAQRSRGVYTVVDVGGSATGWSRDVIDCIVDINQPGGTASSIKIFQSNITKVEDWKEIEDYVALHGKFDFSICTHTLEDICTPYMVCQKLEAISKAGYIATPSKYRELSYIEEPTYRGYLHHRWIFDIHDGVLTAYPKQGFLENDPRCQAVQNPSKHLSDLHYVWQNTIGLRIVNSDYLGPTPQAVLNMYDPLLCG